MQPHSSHFLLNCCPDPVVVVDAEGRSVLLNQAAVELERQLGRALQLGGEQTQLTVTLKDGSQLGFTLHRRPLTWSGQPAEVVFVRALPPLAGELATARQAVARLEAELSPQAELLQLAEARALAYEEESIRLRYRLVSPQTTPPGLDEVSPGRAEEYLEKNLKLAGYNAYLRSRSDALQDEVRRLERQLEEKATVDAPADPEAQRLAYSDSVTGLPNLNLLRRYLAEVSDAVRLGQSAAMLIIDLDHLPAINRSLGRPAADALLLQAGQRVQHELEPEDRLGRHLGGEFVAILMGEKAQAVNQRAQSLAQRLVSRLAEPFHVAGQAVHVTVSVGGVMLSEGSAEELLNLARESLRSDEVQFFGAELHKLLRERTRLSEDLTRALPKNQFKLRYQPIVDLASLKMCGAEVVVRWDHPHLGSLDPPRFLDRAAEAGLLPALGDWIVGEACGKFAGHKDLFLSLNLSARQAAQVDLTRRLVSGATRAKLKLENLVVELEESALTLDPDRLDYLCKELARSRVRVAIDNFGADFCSVRRLQDCGISMVKLDPGLVRQVPVDARAARRCATLICLARSLQIASVAKGVETAEQASAVQRLGCDMAQGHLFAPPSPGGKLAELARAMWSL